MKRAFITGLLVIGAACMILACGKKEEETKEQKPETELSDGGTEETEQEEAEDQENAGEDDAQAEETPDEGAENYQIIGTESPEAHKVLLTNRTGEAVTGFTVKASTDAEFPANLMASGMKVENDETVCLYYTVPETGGAETGSGKMLRTTYEFSVTNEGGREIRISGLIFDDIQQAELCFEDEVGFIKYVSVESGEEISTKEMALSLQVQ